MYEEGHATLITMAVAYFNLRTHLAVGTSDRRSPSPDKFGFEGSLSARSCSRTRGGRILKVMAYNAAPVKNYHLELLTLLAQEAAPEHGGTRVADGSMQLVLDVLQSIADDKMPTSGAAETQVDLSEAEFDVLVSKLKVTLVYGHSGRGSSQPSTSNNLVLLIGMSVMMEDLAFALPDLPGIRLGQHCIYIAEKAQLQARGCVISSPHSPSIVVSGSGTRCHLIDCCFRPNKERSAASGVLVDDSSNLVAVRCLFQRCRVYAVEVRSTGSRAHLKGCKFLKCLKQAVMLYDGGKELKMEECLIERCGDLPIYHLLLVACGTAQLRKCSFVNNKCDAVVVQCDNHDRQSAPVLDMRECILKGNMSGVIFGFSDDRGSGGGSGVLVNNKITDNSSFGVRIHDVAHNRQIQLIGNDFCGNGPNLGLRKMDVILLKGVHDHVVMKNNHGTIINPPALVWDMVDAILGPGV
eukprot:gene4202-14307_t